MKELKKKIIVLEESPLGTNILESVAEELRPIGRTDFHRKKNPNKKVLFQVINRWKEKLSICYYVGNDFLNVFIDAGIHKVRFIITKEQLDSLISTCTMYKSKLKKTS
jgi:hypothetical protein